MTGICAVIVPKWGFEMQEGRLLSWSKEEGQPVERGEELAEIETSKVVNTIEAPSGGVLRRRIGRPNSIYPCGAVIGVIADADVSEEEVERFVRLQGVVAARDATATSPEYREIEVRGYPTRVAERASGESNLLLLHGLAGDLTNWQAVQARLGTHCSSYAIDLPGHGTSMLSFDASGGLNGLVEWLVTALDRLNMRRAHIVAHSMSGMIAIRLAHTRPGICASLSLISPAGAGSYLDQGILRGLVTANNRRDVAAILKTMYARPEAISSGAVEALLRYKRMDGASQVLQAYSAMLSSDHQDESWRELKSLKVPVQIIWGREDRVIPVIKPGSLPADIQVTVLEQTGHMAHIEASKPVSTLLEAWVRHCVRSHPGEVHLPASP